MPLKKELKNNVITGNAQREGDTGSPEVQVALLTAAGALPLKGSSDRRGVIVGTTKGAFELRDSVRDPLLLPASRSDRDVLRRQSAAMGVDPRR